MRRVGRTAMVRRDPPTGAKSVGSSMRISVRWEAQARQTKQSLAGACAVVLTDEPASHGRLGLRGRRRAVLCSKWECDQDGGGE